MFLSLRPLGFEIMTVQCHFANKVIIRFMACLENIVVFRIVCCPFVSFTCFLSFQDPF